jgi:D-beta-D-heptose 7-phosphate kinase/D-beta-D-heptose 1-phosphate adenosyltransferase
VNRFGSKIIITRAEKGVSVFDYSGEKSNIPSNAVSPVIDVSGAGDTFMAALALACASNATLAEAAEIANCAAGIKLGKVGAVPVSFEELLGKYVKA